MAKTGGNESNTLMLCGVNSKYVHSSLGVWYLKAAVEAAVPEVRVRVVEGTLNQEPADILGRILAEKPRWLGFSCYIWNIGRVKELVREIAEKAPEVQVFLGGPEAGFNARALLEKLPSIFAVLSGEGEESLPMLVQCLLRQGELEGVSGLCFRKGKAVQENLLVCLEKEPPSPYSGEYFEALGGRIAYLETSRGCPYSCAFCLSGRRDPVRFFSLERVKADILRLAASGTQTVKLVDRTFNCNPERAYSIFQFILENAERMNGVCFHFEVAGDLFDEQTLALLENAPPGLIQMEAGLQSFHGETLEAVNRKTDLKRLKENLRWLIGLGNMHIHIDLIAGLPLEDYETFGHSFDQAYGLEPHMLQMGFLKLLHGAELRERADELGYVYSSEPPYEIEACPWLSQKELESLHRTEDALERIYNSGRFRGMARYLMEVLGCTSFQFYEEAGEIEGVSPGIPLDTYTALLYEYFSRKLEVDRYRLRDEMVLDRLATVNTGRLPECLKVADSRLKEVAAKLRAPGKKLGIAILYAGKERVVAADYGEKDPVLGTYTLREFRLEELGL